MGDQVAEGRDADRAGAAEYAAGGRAAVRVFISYAHDDDEHVDRVRGFWLFLREQRIDARLDLPAGEQRQDWTAWMTREIRDAERIVVIASPKYKQRAEGDGEPGEGRGVRWEAGLIQERVNADQRAGLSLVLPVILPGGSADDLPLWLRPTSTTHYRVSAYTVAGAEALVRVLTGQPWETVPPLGQAPVLPPRDAGEPVLAVRPVLHTTVVIEAAVADGQLESVVWLAGAQLCQRRVPLPVEVAGVWRALGLPALTAAGRLVAAGRLLAGALLDDAAQQVLGGLVGGLVPGDTVEVVLAADGPALALPLELLRLADGSGAGMGPLGLLAGVSVSRRLVPAGRAAGSGLAPAAAAAPLAGPLKVLAAVAAPDETKTANRPLDAEAEMAAVLDAVTEAAGRAGVQVRILEVASLPAIRQALEDDAYHVLHLSAHGSAGSVELEDEDGNPAGVSTQELLGALRHAGRPVPLIVLSSCSGGATGSQAMAAGLLAQGADRVIAMLAPVTDDYATTLARRLYGELAAHPQGTPGQALARARYRAEEDRAAAGDQLPMPEYGLATLLTRTADGPLVDPAAPSQPLPVATTRPGGKQVRELPMGTLIGRRPQLRAAMGVLRRTDKAVQRFGAAGGVVLTGIGGIGKTAVAGRVMSRLRDEGWLIVVHEGRWNPAALITTTADGVQAALASDRGPAQAAALADPRGPAQAALRQTLAVLADPASDDEPKIAAVARLLDRCQLLVVLDDFEQNLTSGGEAFLDPAFDQVLTKLADAASTGALLVTCRYPLPGPDRFLAQVPVPALSAAELRRLFLRLPALAGLDAEDRRLLMRTIGGHPRLIEFTDALLRGGHSSLRHVQVRLRDLARDHDVTLTGERPLTQALDQALLLGSADILLSGLLTLLTSAQTQVLHQVAVCRAPMTLEDLAFTLTPQQDTGPGGNPPQRAALRTDTSRLADLTLLDTSDDIVMHPWTAALVTRNTPVI